MIKYIFDNDIKDKSFTSNIPSEPYHHFNNKVYVHPNGTISLGLSGLNAITDRDLFTVEIEEKITENTILERCVVFLENGAIYAPTRFNIKFIKEFYKEPIKIYAVINENLQLIWERGD